MTLSMNKINILIFGAGGHTRSLLNLIDDKKFNIVGILDNSTKSYKNETINGVKIIKNRNEVSKDSRYVLSIGNNEKRKIIFI